MRHTMMIFAIVLSLLSGFVLSQLWAMDPIRPGAIPAAPDPQTEVIVQTFYQAVNQYFDGGNEDEMRNLLHQKFVTHQSGSSWTGSVEDYLDHLDSVRRLFPGIQIESDVASLGNNTASVTLSVNIQQSTEFAGMGIDPADAMGRLENLRIERGQIIERWSSAPIAGGLNTYSALSVDLPVPGSKLVARVQEISLEGASTMEINHTKQMVLIVAAGETRLDVIERPEYPALIWRPHPHRVAEPETIKPEATVSLLPLDAIYLPGGTKFRIWNSGEADTSLIVLEFGISTTQATSASSPLAESLSHTLWSGIELEGVGDRLTLSLGQATLLPASLLSNERVEGLDLALVTGGAIDVTGVGDTRIRNASGTRAEMIEGQAVLGANEASATGPSSSIRYQTNGESPVSVWFFSIEPASESIDANGENASDEQSPIPAPALNPSIK